MANEFKIKKGLIVTGASGGTVVDIQGSQGQLFSVTDDLSGSIFAVSDISGIPIFEVDASGESTFYDNLNVRGNILLTGEPTTANQGRIIDFTGFDKEGTTDFSDRAYIQHTENTGGHSGSVLVISSQNDSSDGIAFSTHSSSMLKHNGNNILTAATTFGGDVSGTYNAIAVANDSHTHDGRYYTETESDARFTKYVDLTSQVQLSSYRKSVVALCNVDNTDIDRNSYSIGTLTFHRTNGLSAPIKLDIAIEKRYNAQGPNVVALGIGGNSFVDNIQYITFDYNGTTYGGIEFYFSAAQHHEVTFYGKSNFDIFGLDYLNTNGNVVLNQEVEQSISTANVVLETDFFFNNNKVWHAGNDGPDSGLDADTLDGQEATDFVAVTGDTMTGQLSINKTGSSQISVNTRAYFGTHYDNNDVWIYGGPGDNILLGGGIGNIQNDVNVGNGDLIVPNGDVGIGTTSPAYLLDVNEDDNVLAFRVTGGGGGAPIASFVRDVGSTGSQVNINAQNNFPQIQFTNTGNTFSIGGDTSGNFKISDNTGIGTNDRITIDNAGNVGIETTDPLAKFHVQKANSGRTWTVHGNTVAIFENNASAYLQIITGNSNEGEIWFSDTAGQARGRVRYEQSTDKMEFWTAGAERAIIDSSGNLHVDQDIVAYSSSVTPSDIRLKDNINTIDSALDKVKKLRGVEYTWNAGSRKDKKDLGVIAQEVEEVLPDIVREHKMDFIDEQVYKTVDYEKITAVLIEAIKEQQKQIDELKNQLDAFTD